MKRYFTLLLLAACLLCGCKKDEFKDVDGLPPSIEAASDRISTEPGREFVIRARIEDKDGIKSVNLKNTEFDLNKTIDLTLDSTVYAYDLSYRFTTKKDLKGDNFPLEITVLDRGGRSTKSTVMITMDGDFTNPVFAIAPDKAVTVLLKSTTRLNVKFTVNDDKALKQVRIEIPEINYTKDVTEFTNSGKMLQFNEAINLPAALATYTLSLVATDKAGLEAKSSSIITVSEMPDFPKMYLTDVADAAKLNSDIFGVPMLISRSGAFTYKARYYSAAAGTQIRFIPQKTDFSPICFGVDPLNNNLLTDDPEVSLPISLPAKGYYEINFNVKTGVYSVTPYTPSDAPLAIGSPMLLDPTRPGEGSIPLQIGLVGSGVPNAGNWNTASPLLLTQNPENKYQFSVEMTLQAGATIGFIIQAQHSWGWWPEPFWRWDRSDDPEANVSNDGENPGDWKVTTSGRYIFKFDTHLKRSQLYPIN
ncbi:SusF/SusE family outer membrane protein [Pararcticibacter amylolyticus]|nr:SusF/SusE family outer membrane protein [Pararcticibacter amylolyticus]